MPAGGEYVMLTPDIGLMYVAVDFLCKTVTKAGINQGSSSLPLVINCTYIKEMDYTTAMVIS
jgi:sodium-independent sulfate anion transporter 11